MQKLKRNTVQFPNTGHNLITKTLKLIRFKIAIIKNINSQFNLFALGNKADLPSKSNISKTGKENDSLNSRFLIISLPKISIFIGFALVLLQLLMFKVYENFRILKIEFFNFSKTRHQMMQQYIYYAENDKNNKNNNPNVVCQNVFSNLLLLLLKVCLSAYVMTIQWTPGDKELKHELLSNQFYIIRTY